MLTRRGILVPSLLDSVKQELTVEVVSDFTGVSFGSKKIRCYRPFLNQWLLPAFYQACSEKSPSIEEVSSIDLEFKGKLQTNQAEIYQKAVDHLQGHHGGLLCLPTGFGKTVLALAILARMKVKTLILVHKEFLKEQWVNRIRSFLPSARIGSLQGSVVDVIDKDIVLGMMQSVSMKGYPLSAFQGFGMCILDEAHHCPAETFSNVFFTANCKYMLGLTATPFRKDGLHSLYKWFLGDIIVHVQNPNIDQVQVDMIEYWNPKYQEPEPLTVTGDINMPALVTRICEIPERTQMIVDLIHKQIPSGRQVLVLSDRRAHCQEMFESLQKKGVSVGLYIGGMKRDQYEDSERKQVIVATFSLVAEGFDVPRLDTLVLASPKSDVVQACGRILRHGGFRKHSPLILDIRDQYSIFYSQARKRKKFYEESNFYKNKEFQGEYEFI